MSDCENCDYDSENDCASSRRDTATCDDCGRTLCADCLADMAIEKGLISACNKQAYLEANDASKLLWRCEESQQDLCAECFEDKEG